MKSKVKKWFHGLLSAFVTGGASAATAGVGTSVAHAAGAGVAPLDAKQLGVVLLSSGVFGALAYLKQSPLPPPENGDTTFTEKPKG